MKAVSEKLRELESLYEQVIFQKATTIFIMTFIRPKYSNLCTRDLQTFLFQIFHDLPHSETVATIKSKEEDSKMISLKYRRISKMLL